MSRLTLNEKLELTRLFKRYFDLEDLKQIVHELGLQLGNMGYMERDNLIREILQFSDDKGLLPELFQIATAISSAIKLPTWTQNYIAAEISPKTEAIENTTAQTGPKNIFISYNHHDKSVADTLKTRLNAAGFDVTIDSENMKAGDDIETFILNCIRQTDATLSIVSQKSLLSAWVAMETINTHSAQKLSNSDKQFIACYIEDDFFDEDFTDKLYDTTEEEIKKLEQRIQRRVSQGRNVRDLSNTLTRYKDLHHHLDDIIRRLRESLCISLIGDDLDKNFNKIVEALRG